MLAVVVINGVGVAAAVLCDCCPAAELTGGMCFNIYFTRENGARYKNHTRLSRLFVELIIFLILKARKRSYCEFLLSKLSSIKFPVIVPMLVFLLLCLFFFSYLCIQWGNLFLLLYRNEIFG